MTFHQAGFSDVTAVWSPDHDIDIVEITRECEDEIPDNCRSQKWNVYVIGEQTDLDQMRESIDDLIRGGTLVYGGKEFLKWAHSKVETDSDSSDERSGGEDDEEFLQEHITNF